MIRREYLVHEGRSALATLVLDCAKVKWNYVQGNEKIKIILVRVLRATHGALVQSYIWKLTVKGVKIVVA